MILQRVVILWDLDSKYPFLRLSNEWERLLSGRVLGPAYHKKIEFIQVDVLTSGDEGDMLYCGILEKYTLNSKVGLENIYMSSVYRRLSSDYQSSNSAFTTEMPLQEDTVMTEADIHPVEVAFQHQAPTVLFRAALYSNPDFSGFAQH